MKKASNILFTIGKVIHIIGMVSLLFVALIGIYGIVNPSIAYDELIKDPDIGEIALDDVRIVGVVILIAGLIGLAFSAVSLFLTVRSKKKIDDGARNDSPYVVLLIFSFLSDNIFMLVSGILELAVRDTEKKEKKPDILDGE